MLAIGSKLAVDPTPEFKFNENSDKRCFEVLKGGQTLVHELILQSIIVIYSKL